MNMCRVAWTRHSGFSLPELLVAMGLGLFLLAGLSRLFVDHHIFDREQAARIEAQQSGRLALQHLGRAVRESGAWSCPDPVDGESFERGHGLRGTSWPHIPDTLVERDLVPGGDVLGVFAPLNCEGGPPRRIWFYLSNRGGNVDNPTGLFRLEQGSAAEELVEGISALRLRFGLAPTPGAGNVVSWKKANQVSDWDRVLAVRIHLFAGDPDRGVSREHRITFVPGGLRYL